MVSRTAPCSQRPRRKISNQIVTFFQILSFSNRCNFVSVFLLSEKTWYLGLCTARDLFISGVSETSRQELTQTKADGIGITRVPAVPESSATTLLSPEGWWTLCDRVPGLTRNNRRTCLDHHTTLEPHYKLTGRVFSLQRSRTEEFKILQFPHFFSEIGHDLGTK